MAVNKPKGDNARKGAVHKRSQARTTIGGATGYTKRDRSNGEFTAVTTPIKANKAAKGKGPLIDSVKQRARAVCMPFPHDVDLKRERKRILGTAPHPE